MLLYKSVFIGQIPALTINKAVTNVVNSTRRLGVVIDNKLRWWGGGGGEGGGERGKEYIEKEGKEDGEK